VPARVLPAAEHKIAENDELARADPAQRISTCWVKSQHQIEATRVIGERFADIGYGEQARVSWRLGSMYACVLCC
jgi:hypothetical protein